ncbi:hypothetical protein TRFO_11432 [Tritrichomonas foetus]|uniref:Uncharacterized protein n=1 Tax=Tritrichomonas foetus TaxID=1144522 RepID=A0A1J4J9P5_9EUKA|nr:hypothetical protein TRFO_11432 [Tritrichomonas foetus]|eukprot:OHS93964.1 hypothetical protein TRFO_11432 [Tritrichomonas foetus]
MIDDKEYIYVSSASSDYDDDDYLVENDSDESDEFQPKPNKNKGVYGLVATLKVRTMNLSTNMGTIVDIYDFCQRVKCATFNPRMKNKTSIRLTGSKKVSACLFQNGLLYIPNCHTQEEGFLIAQRVSKLGKRAQINLKVDKIEVVSIIGVAKCGFKIRLQRLLKHPNARGCIKRHNPVTNSASIALDVPETSVNAGVYSTGSVVFRGAKNFDEMMKAARFLQPMLEECQTRPDDGDTFLMKLQAIERDKVLRAERKVYAIDPFRKVSLKKHKSYCSLNSSSENSQYHSNENLIKENMMNMIES